MMIRIISMVYVISILSGCLVSTDIEKIQQYVENNDIVQLENYIQTYTKQRTLSGYDLHNLAYIQFIIHTSTGSYDSGTLQNIIETFQKSYAFIAHPDTQYNIDILTSLRAQKNTQQSSGEANPQDEKNTQVSGEASPEEVANTSSGALYEDIPTSSPTSPDQGENETGDTQTNTLHANTETGSLQAQVDTIDIRKQAEALLDEQRSTLNSIHTGTQERNTYEDIFDQWMRGAGIFQDMYETPEKDW